MKANLIQIGNSKGVRIPKAYIEQCNLGSEVEIKVDKDKIIISSLKNPREGWAEQFEKMAKAGDDKLIDGDYPENEFDQEWEWK